MSTHSKRPASTATDWLRSLLLEDHCAWANRYVYWLKSPLGVLGMTAVASLLLGLFVAPQGYVLLAAIMAVIVTGLAWPKIGIRGLECEIAFVATRAREGKPTPVEVRISNRWPFPVWGLMIEDGFFDVEPGENRSAVALARISGWSRTTFRWDFTPEQRGRYPKVTPSLATAFPFGLWTARKPVRVEGSIVAWPQTFWLPPYPLTAAHKAWTGEPSDAHAGTEGERIGVREHRHGDSMRFVHWAKTARHDRLIVSEREGAALRTASVRVDTDPHSHTGAGVDSTMEWSIRIAASVADTFLAQGAQIEMQLGRESGTFAAGRSDQARMMDWLAEYKPTESDSSQAAAEAGRPRRKPSTRLRIGTTRSEPATGEATILLDADAFSTDNRAAVSPSSGSSWILVNEPSQVADQLLNGWRRASREISHGA